jgi:hypothetical protein
LRAHLSALASPVRDARTRRRTKWMANNEE